MGGKVSRAKRACMTEKNVTGSLTLEKGGSVGVSKTYDTTCVANILNTSK